eukprot:gene2280-5274_t
MDPLLAEFFPMPPMVPVLYISEHSRTCPIRSKISGVWNERREISPGQLRALKVLMVREIFTILWDNIADATVVTHCLNYIGSIKEEEGFLYIVNSPVVIVRAMSFHQSNTIIQRKACYAMAVIMKANPNLSLPDNLALYLRKVMLSHPPKSAVVCVLYLLIRLQQKNLSTSLAKIAFKSSANAIILYLRDKSVLANALCTLYWPILVAKLRASNNIVILLLHAGRQLRDQVVEVHLVLAYLNQLCAHGDNAIRKQLLRHGIRFLVQVAHLYQAHLHILALACSLMSHISLALFEEQRPDQLRRYIPLVRACMLAVEKYPQITTIVKSACLIILDCTTTFNGQQLCASERVVSILLQAMPMYSSQEETRTAIWIALASVVNGHRASQRTALRLCVIAQIRLEFRNANLHNMWETEVGGVSENDNPADSVNAELGENIITRTQPITAISSAGDSQETSTGYGTSGGEVMDRSSNENNASGRASRLLSEVLSTEILYEFRTVSNNVDQSFRSRLIRQQRHNQAQSYSFGTQRRESRGNGHVIAAVCLFIASFVSFNPARTALRRYGISRKIIDLLQAKNPAHGVMVLHASRAIAAIAENSVDLGILRYLRVGTYLLEALSTFSYDHEVIVKLSLALRMVAPSLGSFVYHEYVSTSHLNVSDIILGCVRAIPAVGLQDLASIRLMCTALAAVQVAMSPSDQNLEEISRRHFPNMHGSLFPLIPPYREEIPDTYRINLNPQGRVQNSNTNQQQSQIPFNESVGSFDDGMETPSRTENSETELANGQDDTSDDSDFGMAIEFSDDEAAASNNTLCPTRIENIPMSSVWYDVFEWRRRENGIVNELMDVLVSLLLYEDQTLGSIKSLLEILIVFLSDPTLSRLLLSAEVEFLDALECLQSRHENDHEIQLQLNRVIALCHH